MARKNVRLYHPGMAAQLKSDDVRKAVNALAEEIADNVRRQGVKVGDVDGGPLEKPLPVRVLHQTTDRARASVVLAHPAGIAVQAKHGALSKAAAQAGLEVRGD